MRTTGMWTMPQSGATVGRQSWSAQADLVTRQLRHHLGSRLTGSYVHGSAALGGWSSGSDLDMLVIVRSGAETDWAATGRSLLATILPNPVLELSVVAASHAAAPEAPWPFLLHVNQAEARADTDSRAGDPDLLMHYVVARTAGIALLGPPARSAFGPVPRSSVVTYLCEELRWGLTQADQRYAVLNACRALAYFEEGAVLSKVDGGRWARRRGWPTELIDVALDAQVAGVDLGPSTPAARDFVGAALATLRSGIEEETTRNI
jgi:hypothetical protein